MAGTPRLQALQNLSGQLPVANQKVAAGQAAARDLQLQQSLSKLPQGAAPATAAQIGAGQAAAAGQDQLKSASNQIQQQGQIGEMGIKEQAIQNQASVANQQASNRQLEMDNSKSLAEVDEKAKQELFDKQIQFRKDEAGRTVFNERQLADYAKLNAKSDEEYKSYAQKAELANRNIEEDLRQKYQIAKQRNDQASQRKIEQMQLDMKKAIAKKKADAANKAAIWTTGGTIIGGAIGAVAGGPAGAAAGASVGGGLGGLAYSQTEE
jgi:hypothetical protein